jgi:SAM-dependent methyltransferase
MGHNFTPQADGRHLMTDTTTPIDAAALQQILAPHLAMYRKKVPYYQATMLDSLRELWLTPHDRLLDVGAGTGVIAEAMSKLFPVRHVQAVDVVDRFCDSLSVASRAYDGQTLPFESGSFDAATLNNVMHHVPVPARVGLLREIRRVVNGPLYIKDHETRGRVDDLRLTALDAIGNIPFSGMVRARYLPRREWEALAAQAGYRIAAPPLPQRALCRAVPQPARSRHAFRTELTCHLAHPDGQSLLRSSRRRDRTRRR